MGNNRFIALILFVVCGLISSLFWFYQNPKNAKFTLSSFNVSYILGPQDRDLSRETANFVSQLREYTSTLKGVYAVSVYRLEEGAGYGFNENINMPAASFMKVPILIKAFEISLNKDHDDLFVAIGKYSDNDAPATLADLVGREKIEAKLRLMGMKNSSFKENQTTSYDVSMMWKEVYKLPDLWPYLEDSIFEDRIRPALPKDITFIHKIANNDQMWADSGIIKCSVSSVQCPGPLVLVVMNKDVDFDEANTALQIIAKKVWDYEVTRAEKLQQPQPSPIPQSE